MTGTGPCVSLGSTKTLSDAPPGAPDCNGDATGAFAGAEVSSFASHAAHNAQGNPEANTQQGCAERQTQLRHRLRRIQQPPRIAKRSERREPPRLPECPSG